MIARPLVLVVLALSGCGYAPVREARAATKVRIVAGECRVPDASVMADALFAARSELADEGVASDAGETFRIDVLGASESSSGIVDRGAPLARGTAITLTGRASSATGDTGDITVVLDAASEFDARADAARHDDALHAAARKLGRELARRIAGVSR